MMATAASQKKSVHLYRLLTLTLNQSGPVVRSILDQAIGNVSLHQYLTNNENQIRKAVSPYQRDLLYPKSGNPLTTANLDIPLAVCLLSKVVFHKRWKSKPPPNDKSVEADIERLKVVRKQLAHISSTDNMDEAIFEQKWTDVEQVLNRLNHSLKTPVPNLQQDIDECKTKHLAPGAIENIEKDIKSMQSLLINLENKEEDVQGNVTNLEQRVGVIEEKDKSQVESDKNLTRSDTSFDAPVYEGYECEWTTCIDNKNEEEANKLLEKGQLPDAALIDKACQTFGLNSPILKNICTKIEEKITDSSDCIIYTNACYKETEKDKIVFVVITRGATDYVDLSKVKYNVLFRSIDFCSQEGRMVIDKESDLGFEDSEMAALEFTLKEKASDLMEKHSNLTLASGSLFISHNKYSKVISVERKNCIVFYVTVKGLIPVGEDLLPNKLGKFDTDVREGRFSLAVGGRPGAKHKDLKIGCRISFGDGAGTIGGFVQHPKHGVCAITCAHVVLSEKETLTLLMNESCGIGIGKECFQPKYSENGEGKCGKVVELKLIDGDSKNAGVDVALVKIDKDRLPTSGDFPDCDLPGIMYCLHCKDSLLRKTPSFKNGTVLDTDEITTKNKVVKYGEKTTLTFGKLKAKGAAVRLNTHDIGVTEERALTLKNLIEIKSLGPPFAETGDSGALVFSQDENNKLTAIGLLVGYFSTGSTLVQPICSVLEHLGLERPFSFINFDPRVRRIDEIEESVNVIKESVEEIRTSIKNMSEKLDKK